MSGCKANQAMKIGQFYMFFFKNKSENEAGRVQSCS